MSDGSAGGVIRMVRQVMGLTQAQFGALFGEGRWYISQIERDRRPRTEAFHLAQAIGAYLALTRRA